MNLFSREVRESGERMKIAVLGATGGTGRQIVQQALLAGHHVNALVRRSGALAIEDPKLNVITGDVTDASAVQSATNGTDATLSALGSHAMQYPTRVYSDGVANVVSVMQKNGARRLIVISAVPAAPDNEKDFVNRYVVHPMLYRFFGGGYEDMRRMEALLDRSDLNWTVFRPPALTNAPPSGRYRIAVGNKLSRAFMVSRANLAAAMIKAINEPNVYRRVITIAN